MSFLRRTEVLSMTKTRPARSVFVTVAAALLVSTVGAISSVTAVFADEIDDYLNGQREEHNIPGLALLVIQDGKVTRSQGYGLANVEHEVAVTPETLFQSGSIGKMFTAAGILLLVEEGKLSLDDRLAKHFPGAPTAWHRITVRQLLAHTSGLHDYDLVVAGDGKSDKLDLRRDYTEEELLEAMMSQPLDFEPGSQWSYSNSGYVVAGILISKISGKHWGEFLRERVFLPSGMKTTGTINERRITKHRSDGYSLGEDDQLLNQDWVSPTWGNTADGALYFSLRDLAAWENTLSERGVLSAESYRQWWTPIELSGGGTYPYGFGWGITEQRGRKLIAHGGSWQGFTTQLSRYVEDDLTIALLANASHASPGAMVRHVAGLIDPDLGLPDPNDKGKPDQQQQKRMQTARSVMEAWGNWQTHDAMCKTMAQTAAGSPRAAYSRIQIGRRLSEATGFVWLGEDTITHDDLQLHGETIRRISYYGVEGEDDKHRYRVFESDGGCIAGIQGG